MRVFTILFVLIIATVAPAVESQTADELEERSGILREDFSASESYANAGRLAFSAFGCSRLALSIYPGEHDRLFELGYTSAKTFFEAADLGKIFPEHLYNLPLILSVDILNSESLSIEFRAGRLYQAAIEIAFENVNSEFFDTSKMIQFELQNCKLLGL